MIYPFGGQTGRFSAWQPGALSRVSRMGRALTYAACQAHTRIPDGKNGFGDGTGRSLAANLCSTRMGLFGYLTPLPSRRIARNRARLVELGLLAAADDLQTTAAVAAKAK